MLGLVVGLLPSLVGAQQRLTAWELAVGGAAAFAREDFVGGLLGAAYRPGGQARLGVSVTGGALDGAVAARTEARAEFLVTPWARRGVGLYAGLGVTYQVAERAPGTAYLGILAGVESAPGRRLGWYAEAGVGGGVRIAAGIRWRRFPDWW